jgi:hypothetical protein
MYCADDIRPNSSDIRPDHDSAARPSDEDAVSSSAAIAESPTRSPRLSRTAPGPPYRCCNHRDRPGFTLKPPPPHSCDRQIPALSESAHTPRAQRSPYHGPGRGSRIWIPHRASVRPRPSLCRSPAVCLATGRLSRAGSSISTSRFSDAQSSPHAVTRHGLPFRSGPFDPAQTRRSRCACSETKPSPMGLRRVAARGTSRPSGPAGL